MLEGTGQASVSAMQLKNEYGVWMHRDPILFKDIDFHNSHLHNASQGA